MHTNRTQVMKDARAMLFKPLLLVAYCGLLIVSHTETKVQASESDQCGWELRVNQPLCLQVSSSSGSNAFDMLSCCCIILETRLMHDKLPLVIKKKTNAVKQVRVCRTRPMQCRNPGVPRIAFTSEFVSMFVFLQIPSCAGPCCSEAFHHVWMCHSLAWHPSQM